MKIVECPRDAMQGIKLFIPTKIKVAYLNQLLKIGFDTLDAGSFVSPKAVPQMSDTAQVLQQLELNHATRILVIVANERGAREACAIKEIQDIGFPMSISETFQMRNTGQSVLEAMNTLSEIQNLCDKNGKRLVAYLSMAFGNPYGDIYHADMVLQMAEILSSLNVKVVSLADTVGLATPFQVTELFGTVSKSIPDMEWGVHLHANPSLAAEKIKSAIVAGCQRIDGALRGHGGCPMAEDQLVGNVATETIVEVLDAHHIDDGLDRDDLRKALLMADSIFPRSGY